MKGTPCSEKLCMFKKLETILGEYIDSHTTVRPNGHMYYDGETIFMQYYVKIVQDHGAYHDKERKRGENG